MPDAPLPTVDAVGALQPADDHGGSVPASSPTPSPNTALRSGRSLWSALSQAVGPSRNTANRNKTAINDASHSRYSLSSASQWPDDLIEEGGSDDRPQLVPRAAPQAPGKVWIEMA